jgi:hypothetical protein
LFAHARSVAERTNNCVDDTCECAAGIITDSGHANRNIADGDQLAADRDVRVGDADRLRRADAPLTTTIAVVARLDKSNGDVTRCADDTNCFFPARTDARAGL